MEKILRAIQAARADARSTAHHYRPTVGHTKTNVRNILGTDDQDLVNKVTSFGWFNTPFTHDDVVINLDWYLSTKK